MDSRLIVKREANKENLWSVDDFLYYAVKLNDYNIGGVPLICLVCSAWFVPTNCELLGKWFSKVVPNGTYVEGSLQHYRNIAEIENRTIYKWKGFHVWIEYVDMASGEEKVLDPCSMAVFSKKYFYESEVPEVKNKIPCSKVEFYEGLEPTKDNILDEFDDYRLAFLLNTVKTFTTSDFGYFQGAIDKWLDEFQENNNIKEIMDKFNDECLKKGLNLEDEVFSLFTDEEKWQGRRFKEQTNLLGQLVSRIEDIKRNGCANEEGEFVLIEDESKKETDATQADGTQKDK